MPFPEDRNKLMTSASALVPDYAQKQRRRMLAALVLLLIALLLVFFRDRQFWFPPSATSESSSPAVAAPASEPAQPALPETHKAKQPSSKGKKHGTAVSNPPVTETGIEPQATISNRTVLPPLQVEVVAGDQHRAVHPGNTSINVELQPPSASAKPQEEISSGSAGPATDAAERVRISPSPNQVISNPVRPSYPTLARQMKVQGSVVLQALIGKSGNIQDLQVASGPSILASAAQEAVKQWRFKPYYQNGQPVETQCSITVNFTISTQ